jgi:diaminohydroxyphosphoribosylaminopyrimidine deaminase/5-amino-6-(5-phosphoribosylamino)uracil reductase
VQEKYMKLALELAERGRGKVNPNPMVGAVIVKENRVIAKGFHECYGEAHAEVNAFINATEDVEGSTLYVTLEPCSHHGKTPPCVDKIIHKKIKKVVIGSLDPNPLVSGKGVKKLIDAGIEVITGVLEDECKGLNRVFMKYIVEKKPFVIMKTAMSLDGKISTKIGESKWITCPESRKCVHQLRDKVNGIMIGVNTVITDNPELTCRIENGNNPVRIIVDSKLRIPMESKVLENQNLAKTIVATTNYADMTKKDEIEKKGVKVLIIKSLEERVDLQELMLQLGQENIDSILLEGGGTLNFSALKQGIVDKVQVYIAPKIIGGENSKAPVGGSGIEYLVDAFNLDNIKSKMIGEDILIEGYIRR